MRSGAAVDWDGIDCVLLDMDGTLLDLHFDNWFWLTVVPERFALSNGISVGEARLRLAPRFLEIAHTMPWYCIDHWSRELGLNIRELKQEAREHVKFLPGAQEFLRALRRAGKRLVLVTNCHPATLAIKDAQVSLTCHFDACYSTHAFGVPKEDGAFWGRFAEQESFDVVRTLFVDDSVPVLTSAQRYGLRHLRAIRCPDSTQPPLATGKFLAVDSVADLLT